MILAGDIGGTRTRIARFEARGGSPGPPLGLEILPSGRFPSLEALIADYLSRHPGEIEAACFGIAGAVVDGVVHVTNLPWTVNVAVLEEALGLRRFHLVNDLVAAGYGIELLTRDDLVLVQEAPPSNDHNAGLLSPGTGLGETILVRVNGRLLPVPSETGHTDFPARTDEEIEVLRAFRARHGRVSMERVISGPGLAALGEFFHQEAGTTPEWKQHREEEGDEGAAGIVSRLGMSRKCASCERALRLFVGAYGAEAGNMALRAVARSGIYLGGITPKLLPALRWPEFLAAFRDKENLRPLLESVPVWVVRNELTGLVGAARYAAMAQG